MMRGCVYSPRLPLMRELSAKLTEGETPDGRINIFEYTASLSYLSLRQKSKIFDTSLVRGRHWCDAKSKHPGKFPFVEKMCRSEGHIFLSAAIHAERDIRSGVHALLFSLCGIRHRDRIGSYKSDTFHCKMRLSANELFLYHISVDRKM